VKSILLIAVMVSLLVISPLFVAPTYSSGNSGNAYPASLIIAKVNPLVTCSATQLCPSFLDKAYGFDTLQGSGTTGSGQTIVIVDACGDPTISTDLQAFDKQWGLSNPTLNIVDVQGAPCSNPNWSIETSLDVEWAHVVAPSATIELLIAAKPSTTDLYGAWSYSLTNSLGNQISNSWGGSGGCGPTPTSLLKTATTDHVTILASAGDSLAWGQGTTQTQQSPADCKSVLTVGGTSLKVTSTGAYTSERVWHDTCSNGPCGTGGGYTSSSEPAYQSSVNIPDTFSALGKPDVSADADPATGVLVYNAGIWYVVGGTSLSCPLWAGFMADVNQIRVGNGFSAAGFVNSFLYKKVYGVNGGSALYGTNFHDITLGNNNIKKGDGWTATTGWDAASGLGTFIAPSLANTLGTSSGA